MMNRASLDRFNSRAVQQRGQIFGEPITLNGMPITVPCTAARMEQPLEGPFAMQRSFTARIPKALLVNPPALEMQVVRDARTYRVAAITDSALSAEWILTCSCDV